MLHMIYNFIVPLYDVFSFSNVFSIFDNGCLRQDATGKTNCRVMDPDVLEELERQVLEECHEAVIHLKPVYYMYVV